MMRYYSIFSGIEAASVAWGPLKWTPLLFSEIDEFPSAVLKDRYPNVPNLGDITKINWKEAVRDFGKPDLVVGGSPCQSFSIAGSRTGLDGASGLMWEYVRCVREVKPDWILWENVPGALSSSNGEDFRCLLEALDALGYGLAWRVLDAQFFGVAQRRERVFLVGRLGDPDGPCKVLFESESLRWDTPTSREKRKELACGAGGSVDATSGALNQADPQNMRVHKADGASPTLTTQEGRGPQPPNVLVAGFRYHQGANAGSIGYSVEQSPTLDTAKPPAVTLKIRSGCEGGGKGALITEDMSCTLGTQNDQTVFEPVSSTDNMDSYSVRRLTPRECERLQGFPDDWTKVPYRGKPADECPDTPRYKAIGNSMCVNVMRWIGVRIQEVDK